MPSRLRDKNERHFHERAETNLHPHPGDSFRRRSHNAVRKKARVETNRSPEKELALEDHDQQTSMFQAAAAVFALCQ